MKSQHLHPSPEPAMSPALERARRICLALPESTEQEAWGEPTFRVKKKIFAMFANNHHQGRPRGALASGAGGDAVLHGGLRA
jgi:hypothetical protein